MAFRIPITSVPRATATSTLLRQHNAFRGFQTSRRLLADVAPVKKPVGAFRGTIFGFLLGSFIAGSGLYYYVVDEYKVSNQLLTEDIYALQSAVQRLEGYVKGLEDQVSGKK
ncbi:hypothetical protein K431DRAFT_282916 [Polychaeton citri CBS 116435]|uniref:Uncharacterized protein n=1 Tax=Polychaeton citri CBS 116435 TaxID=1314669 RepID=A0A9P4US67_9PEZI|nr:hypothetical protein K431DRAFT_282916 [Polychaeton citri CBS 116435]